jgi:hypothetical protein
LLCRSSTATTSSSTGLGDSGVVLWSSNTSGLSSLPATRIHLVCYQ